MSKEASPGIWCGTIISNRNCQLKPLIATSGMEWWNRTSDRPSRPEVHMPETVRGHSYVRDNDIIGHCKSRTITIQHDDWSERHRPMQALAPPKQLISQRPMVGPRLSCPSIVEWSVKAWKGVSHTEGGRNRNKLKLDEKNEDARLRRPWTKVSFSSNSKKVALLRSHWLRVLFKVRPLHWLGSVTMSLFVWQLITRDP